MAFKVFIGFVKCILGKHNLCLLGIDVRLASWATMYLDTILDIATRSVRFRHSGEEVFNLGQWRWNASLGLAADVL